MKGAPVLNRALALSEAQQSPDGAGGFVQVWQTLGTVWASVAPGTGRARASAEANVSRVPYKITVRAAPMGAPSRPRAGQRFVEGARSYDIVAVAEADRQGRYLTCFVEEEVTV